MRRVAVAVTLLSLLACGPDEAVPGDAGPEPVAPTLTPQASGTSALLQAVSPVNDEVAWASGHEGAVVRTLDGGDTWTTVPTPVGDSLQFRDVHAFSAEEAALLTAGNGPASRLYHTTDGGSTWTLAYLMEDERGFLDCLDFWDARGFAYGDSFDGIPFVLRSGDGGRTWSRLAPGVLPTAPEGEGGFAASGTCARVAEDGVGWIATGAGGAARILRTSDHGASWEAAEVPVVRGDAAGLTTVSFRDLLVGIALGGDLAQMEVHTDNAARSTDGGVSWLTGSRPRLVGPVYGSDWVPGTDVVVAVGPGGADWSADGGSSWMALDTLTYWAAAFASPSAGWMVGPGGRITNVSLTR